MTEKVDVDKLPLDDIFQGMATEAFDAAGAKGWDSVIQFRVLGQTENVYNLKIKDQTCTMIKGEVESPKVVIRMSEKDFRALIKGELRPDAAYMTGKLRFRGDMNDLLRMGAFFKQR